MSFQHRKTVTFWLAQAARNQRISFGAQLSTLGLYAGQELVLKSLAEENGQTMGALAASLGVQPPTVTKMTARLAAQGLVERRASQWDARQSHVFISDKGLDLIAKIDKLWKRIERHALQGFDDKERRQLRKFLKRIEKNIAHSTILTAEDEEADEETFSCMTQNGAMPGSKPIPS